MYFQYVLLSFHIIGYLFEPLPHSYERFSQKTLNVGTKMEYLKIMLNLFGDLEKNCL